MNFRNRWEDAVWERYGEGGEGDPASKLLLLALGRKADWQTGRRCFPGLPLLAKLCCCSTDTIRRARERVERDGWITCYARPGRSTEYTLSEKVLADDPSQIARGSKLQGVANSEGLQIATPPLANCDPTPSKLRPDHNHDHNHLSKDASAGEALTAPQLLAAALKDSFRETGRNIDDDAATSAAGALLRLAPLRACAGYIKRKTGALRGRNISDSGALKALLADARKGLATSQALDDVEARRAAPSASPAPAQVQREYSAPDAPTPEQAQQRRRVASQLFGGGDA